MLKIDDKYKKITTKQKKKMLNKYTLITYGTYNNIINKMVWDVWMDVFLWMDALRNLWYW